LSQHTSDSIMWFIFRFWTCCMNYGVSVPLRPYPSSYIWKYTEHPSSVVSIITVTSKHPEILMSRSLRNKIWR
jgi:hypothetical protein